MSQPEPNPRFPVTLAELLRELAIVEAIERAKANRADGSEDPPARGREESPRR